MHAGLWQNLAIQTVHYRRTNVCSSWFSSSFSVAPLHAQQLRLHPASFSWNGSSLERLSVWLSLPLQACWYRETTVNRMLRDSRQNLACIERLFGSTAHPLCTNRSEAFASWPLQSSAIPCETVGHIELYRLETHLVQCWGTDWDGACSRTKLSALSCRSSSNFSWKLWSFLSSSACSLGWMRGSWVG